MLTLLSLPANPARRRRGWLVLAGVILLHGLLLWGLGLYRPLATTEPVPLTVLTATVMLSQGSQTERQTPSPLPEVKPPPAQGATPARPERRTEPVSAVQTTPATSITTAVPLPPAPQPSLPSIAPGPGTVDKGSAEKGPADKSTVIAESNPAGTSLGPAGAGKTGGAVGAVAVELPSSQAAYLQNPRPEYPRISRQRGEQGRVMVRVLIGADGLAQQTEISKSSGFPRLDQAALGAVAAWRFVPGKRNGVPEAMWFTVPIGFCLDADGVQCQP